MVQMARNVTDASSGFLTGQRYLLYDRDAKFCTVFQEMLRSGVSSQLPFRRAVPISMRSQNAGCDPV